MRRKWKISALLCAVLLLGAWLWLRMWQEGRQPVTVQDITVVVDGGSGSKHLRLWHNYYNNTEYLFLPAFCKAELPVRITLRRRGSVAWDGHASGGQGYLYDLTEGRHSLQAGGSEFTVEVMRSASVPALFIYTASGSLTHIEEEKGNGESALYEMVDADGQVIAAGQIRKLKSRGNSTFLEDTLYRLCSGLGLERTEYLRMLADSFLISTDNAHAMHPDHPEKSDPTNRPCLNAGIVIKYHGGQKYTTDACSAARMKRLCRMADVPFQTFANRSDLAGGSTLGNLSAARVPMESVDIGLPQLSMHSAVETAGVRDTWYLESVLGCFFGGQSG